MGDRSNINLIQSRTESGEYLGINLYSHWGGLEPQLKALALIARQRAGLDERGRGFQLLLQSLLEHEPGVIYEDAWCTSEITYVQIFHAASRRAAELTRADNQHGILTVDFVTPRIIYASEFDEVADIVVAFTPEGAEELYQLLELRLKPQYRPGYLTQLENSTPF